MKNTRSNCLPTNVLPTDSRRSSSFIAGGCNGKWREDFFILSTYIRCIILSNRFLLPGSVMFSTFSSSREAFALIFKLSNKDGNETRIICVNFAVNGKNFFIFQSLLQMGRDQEKCMQTNVQLE